MTDSRQPLHDRRVLVTRAAEQAGPLVQLLEQQGAQVIAIPAIRIEPIRPASALDHCLRRLPTYQWLILTSTNGVAALAAHMADLGIPASAFAHLHGVAVGAATADAMRALGLPVHTVPEEYVAESLVAAIRHDVAGKNILLVRGTLARDVIPVALEAAGAWVDTADAYHTVMPHDSVVRLREAFLSAEPPEIVTFTSSSTVNHFMRMFDASGLERPATLLAASIGPITSSTLREFGWEPWVEAGTHSIQGLVDAIAHGHPSTHHFKRSFVRWMTARLPFR